MSEPSDLDFFFKRTQKFAFLGENKKKFFVWIEKNIYLVGIWLVGWPRSLEYGLLIRT